MFSKIWRLASPPGVALIDTPKVPLNARGDAKFSGHLGYIPHRPNPVFLVRIGPEGKEHD
jgi:hypothetical protein